MARSDHALVTRLHTESETFEVYCLEIRVDRRNKKMDDESVLLSRFQGSLVFWAVLLAPSAKSFCCEVMVLKCSVICMF